MSQTLTLPRRKPRNPLVAATRLRHAGAHRREPSGQRQQAERALRSELARPGDD
jgi:hypothetical protein